MILTHPIRQIAYVVNDIREAARQHHRLFGSGPYFVIDHLERTVEYRGRNVSTDHSVAFGQWGSLQIEAAARGFDGNNLIRDMNF